MPDIRFERELIALGWSSASLPDDVLHVALGAVDDGPRRQLLAIAAIRRQLDLAERAAVVRARSQHVSWDQIGCRLNRRRDSVYRSFHELCETTTDPDRRPT